MIDRTAWDRYEALMVQRPEAFRNTGEIHIVTDRAIVEEYESRTGNVIGVRYESPYRLLVVDLVWEREGEYFPYERILPAVERGAVVCVPVYQEQYLLLRQYRHALRDYQYAFPRGFAEPGLDGARNAEKELDEELGAVTEKLELLGTVVADSGLSGTQVSVWRCKVRSYRKKQNYEGITDTLCVSAEELRQMICRGQITDGFTLAAAGMLYAADQA